MPAERFQKDRLALSRTDVGDLREDDWMVPLGNLIDHVTFDPASAIREHGEAGRGPLRLHFLVHRPTGPPNDSVANQVMRKSLVGRPFVQIDSSTRCSTCIAFRVMSLLASPGFSRPNGVGACFGCFAFHSATPPSTSGWIASRFHFPSGRLFSRRSFRANRIRGSVPYPSAVMKSRPT